MTTSSTVIIGLHNPKSPTNVGAVMRAAGCYNATQVRYNGTRYARAVKFQTDTQNSHERIGLVEMDDLTAGLDSEVKIVCVELAVGATALPHFTHPEQAIYLFYRRWFAAARGGRSSASCGLRAHPRLYEPRRHRQCCAV